MTPVATAKGYRTTSTSANLKNRPENLHIWTDATGKRVIFDRQQATGVVLVDRRQCGLFDAFVDCHC